ncbi:MAG: hypothetical protein KF893_09145 [Caldilineaceae bacterium]|nr:hypothetical protein [Caldilineaceae bacterium]
MADLLKRVQPGDVITAEMWNLAVDTINELLQAGQTGGIQITALLPAGTQADPIRVGTVQQISGQSFGYSIGQTTVTFQGPAGPVVVRRADMLVGSTDTRLLFTVPPIPNLPQGGASMTMRVENGVAHDIRTVFVRPVIFTVSGDVFVNWRANVSPNPNPNPLQADASAQFLYRVQSATNIPASFTLSAQIINASAPIPPQLASSIQLRDQSGNLIPNNRFDLGTAETRDFIVRIPQIPASFANQSFTLEVRALSGNVEGADARSFTVGQTVTPADPNISVEQSGFEVINVTTGNSDAGGGSLVGSTIRLQPDRLMVLFLNVQLLAAGTYDLTIAPAPGTNLNGWTLDLLNPSSPISVTTNNDTSLRNVNFGVTRAGAASAGGAILLRIQRRGEASDWQRQFTLEAMS